MEKFYNAVCWIGVGILLIFGLVVLLYRAAAIVWITVWMIFFSSLPWWERILAPAAIFAGIFFLFRRYTGARGRGIPRNTNFVYYTSETHEEHLPTSSTTEDR